MKDLSQVLSQKERDIERVRREIEALQFVIPLLAEGADRHHEIGIGEGLSRRSRILRGEVASSSGSSKL